VPYTRRHHQHIAVLLQSLDGDVLRSHGCLFGGGTAIALRYGEFRVSVDVDFAVSDLGRYRELRLLLTRRDGFRSILRHGAQAVGFPPEVRGDQYGIRTRVDVIGTPIKFEIILEARIDLERPDDHDEICGVPALTPLDMAATKLLANSDRGRDVGVFSRDVIDLAMMQPKLQLLRLAVAKAEAAYGAAILRDLAAAIEMTADPQWLQRCTQKMAMTDPPGLVWQKIRKLKRVLR
jgi:hypothetical protein